MEFPIRRAEVTDAGQIAECLRELGYGSDSLLVQEKLPHSRIRSPIRYSSRVAATVASAAW